MSVVRTLVTIPMDSALPEDAVTNTWHFICDTEPPAPAELAAIDTALTTFYQAIDTFYSPLVGAAATVKHYDLSDPSPRTPIATSSITLTTTATTNLPEEVALCVSFQGAKISGEQQRNKRGRIYLGPLSGATAGSGSDGNRPAAATLTGVKNAAQALLTASDASAVWSWAVYSPTLNLAFPVVDGWVDNAFDTVRSRGVIPTTRSTFT